MFHCTPHCTHVCIKYLLCKMDGNHRRAMSVFFDILTLVSLFSVCNGQGTCLMQGPCKCQFLDGSVIDLERIAKKGSFAFPYQTPTTVGTNFLYAYNPCFPVTDTDNCKDVAACQKDSNSELRYSIGDAKPSGFFGSDSSITIGYTSTDQHGSSKFLTVNLVCDQSATSPKFEVKGETTTNYYEYTLTSECCCPNGCLGPAPSSGLSFGSILCIIFSCLLVVYLLVGVIYMKFARGASGKEVIPNYSFWTDFPGLVKDGGKFTYSSLRQMCGRKGSYEDI